ncbi:MAG: GAF domain-containing protein, partial [Anaerolineaceae bacterium]
MAAHTPTEISLLSEPHRAILLNLGLFHNNGEPIEALFERVADLLEGALEFDYLGISLLTEGTRVRLVGARPPLDGPVGSEFDLGEAAVARLITNPGVWVFKTDVADPQTAALATAGITHGVAFALHDGSRPLGTFTFGRIREELYAEADLEFIRLFGLMLSHSIAAYLRTEQARAEAACARLLNEAALILNAGQPAGRFFDRLRQLLAAAIPTESMVLLLAEADGSNLRVAGSLPSHNLKRGALIPVSAVSDEVLIGTGNSVNEHLVSDLDSPLVRGTGANAVQRLAVAVLRDGPRLLGILSLGRQENRSFTASEWELLNRLAAFLGQPLAIEERIAATESEAARASLLNQLGLLLNAG